MMGCIWKLVENIENKDRRIGLFLSLNACFWGVLAFVIVCLLMLIIGEFRSMWIYGLCAVGYGGILVGIYGGIFYLYRKY